MTMANVCYPYLTLANSLNPLDRSYSNNCIRQIILQMYPRAFLMLFLSVSDMRLLVDCLS